MAIFSPLRSRRLHKQQQETTQQLIIFLLRQCWLAIPIESVIKVVPMTQIYGDPQNKGLGVTLYQEEELLVIDVAQCIFKEEPLPENVPTQGYLVIVQEAFSGNKVAIPIDSPPAIRRVKPSQIKTIPDGYLTYGNIQCVSSLVVEINDQPPLFLLDVNLLSASLVADVW